MYWSFWVNRVNGGEREGKEGDEKERMHTWEEFSHMFSQWDVETDVCMLMHCVCIVRLRR